MADSPVDVAMNTDQGLVQFPARQPRLLCAIADPVLCNRFQQGLQPLNLEIVVQYVENFAQAIAPLYQTSFDYVVLEADFALDFLKLVKQKQWQIAAIALVPEIEDPRIETLLKAGIADCLDLDQLTPQQLRRSFHHLQQLCQAQYQQQHLSQKLQLIDGHYDEHQSVHHDLQGAIAKLTKERQRLETLQHLTTLIHQRLTNIPELLKVLVQQICQDVPAVQVCAIALFDPKQEGDFLVVTDEIPEQANTFEQLLKQDKSWLHSVYSQGTPHLRNFEATSPMPCSLAAVVIESISSGRLGVLVIGNWHIAQAFDPEDCEFLSAVGEEAAIAIDNARLIKTLEQQNQELSETSRVKDLFIATVSHELRTPMNAILGFSQVLLNQHSAPLGDRQHQIVKRILSNGRSLMTLINDILDFSQMKLTELQLLPSAFNLEELVANIIAELQSLADEKQLQLSLLSDLQNPQITHDEKRLRQILVNLVANALSFTQQGSVEIYLTEDQDQITIQVKDTGIGIAPEHLDNIFSEFWQVQQEIHRTKSGTGLGLAITQSLVQRMHGAIAVESQLNQGSCFTVTLPRSFNLK